MKALLPLTIYLPPDTVKQLSSIHVILEDEATFAITEEYRELTQGLADWLSDFSILLQRTGIRMAPERTDLGNH